MKRFFTTKKCIAGRKRGAMGFSANLLVILVCYPLMYSCNFPFPRMGHQLVGGKGKSCKIENLCYGKKDWIRPPAEKNRGSIISWNTTIIKDRFVEGEMLPLPCFAARPHSYPGTRSRISKKGHGKPHRQFTTEIGEIKYEWRKKQNLDRI